MIDKNLMDWELEMPREIGRSLEYRISYTIYTRVSCVVALPLAVVMPRITLFLHEH
jgi:hypothetical protein